MQIKELHLYSKNLDAQKKFYKEILNFNCILETNNLKLKTKENLLVFINSEREFYYHFAFLISTGTLESAIKYIEKKGVKLLLHNGKKIIDFGTGRAIYFYDMDGNIAEFIERSSLNYKQEDHFTIDSIIKLNEIGLPHKKPAQISNTFVSNYGIQPIDKTVFNNTFCWVGDYHGVIIVTKEGRYWLPTNKPGVSNDFWIHYQEQGKDFKLSVENSKIKLH